MELSAKKVINNLFYYTIALFVVLFSVLFMVSMAGKALAMYQMVVYYIWASLAIVVVIADLIATMMHKYKFIIGLAVYGLMVLCVVVGIIVFAGLSVGGIVPAGALDIFNTLIIYSVALTIGLLVVYHLGLKNILLDEME